MAEGGPVNKRQRRDSNPDSETGREPMEALTSVTGLWVSHGAQGSVKKGLVIHEGLEVETGQEEV